MYQISNYISSISVKDYISGYRDTDKFIAFCKECNRYNNCWACPPFTFDKNEYLAEYNTAYIIGTKIDLSENTRSTCYNSEECRRVGKEIIAEVRLIIDKQLLNAEEKNLNSKAFFAGTCHLCDENDCTRIISQACRYPHKIRPSLESFGFDIGKTTEELLGIKLQWSNDGFLPKYLTLVSGLLTNSVITDIENYFVEK